MMDNKTETYAEKRGQPRHPVRLEVNYRYGDSYLYSRSSNLSEMGIFLTTPTPLGKGTRIELDFAEPGEVAPIRVLGEVVWVQSSAPGVEPGMGILFIDPQPEIRARIKAIIRTVAYLE